MRKSWANHVRDKELDMKDLERKKAERKANSKTERYRNKTYWLKMCEHENAVFPPFLELRYSNYNIDVHRCHVCNEPMISIEKD